MHVEEKEAKPAGTLTEPVSEPLKNLANIEREPLSKEEADEIFFHAVAEIPTQPLPKYTQKQQELAERHFNICIILFVLSLLAGSMIALINQPVVTVTLIPLEKRAS